MIEINRDEINSAGRLIIQAKSCFGRGDMTICRMLIKQARAKLLTESNWRADGYEEVQEFLDFVISLDTDLIRIGKIDMTIPSKMVFFGKHVDEDGFVRPALVFERGTAEVRA